MTRRMRIDFVSDISCPWCAIGLFGLERALERTADAVTAEITFQPFELNPAMPPGGQNIVEHIAQKYGSTPERSAATREMIRSRAAAVGFEMRTSEQSRIYNTFDAHRLLHWAALEGRQKELKHALFEAYFTEGKDPSDSEVLAAAATKPASMPAGPARCCRPAATAPRCARPRSCGARAASRACRPSSSTSAT